VTRALKALVRGVLPEPLLLPVVALYRMARPSELAALARFAADRRIPLTAIRRLEIVLRCLWISLRVDCPHAQAEILAFATHVLLLPPSVEGCIVEAGAYKGGSTAKLSLVCAAVRRRLVVFDSFQGSRSTTSRTS
jgi:hypothetical protein